MIRCLFEALSEALLVLFIGSELELGSQSFNLRFEELLLCASSPISWLNPLLRADVTGSECLTRLFSLPTDTEEFEIFCPVKMSGLGDSPASVLGPIEIKSC